MTTPTSHWHPGDQTPAFHPADLVQAVQRVREPAHLLRERETGRLGIGFGGQPGSDGPCELLTTLPPLYPEWLGDRTFLEVHGLRFPYIAGEMANGISTAEMVIAMGRAGMLGFFGAGGLGLERIGQALDTIEAALGPDGLPWGANLIHNLHDAAAEEAVADLFLRRGVRRVSASAFMRLTPAVVRYACTGLTQDSQGRIQRQNHLFAKLSRPEVAAQFLAPAPAAMVQPLVQQGLLTPAEAALAARIPVAEDITVEADSGGHTDNRPLTGLLPTILRQARETARQYGYARPIRVGAGGGLGTPSGVAAAFGMGAAYVLIGSVNQSALESGLSPAGRELLAQAAIDEVAMAPAADMFELGVKVQVLKRGTMFSIRAQKLYDTYREYGSIEAIPAAERERLEKQIFRAPLEQIWAETRGFFERRDPRELQRAEREPKHRMALLFRWYLGNASKWAVQGTPDRKTDYQIWCGPAMGAFNAWAAGSFLAEPANRTVVQIARNLLEGAAAVTRAQQLRSLGVPVPPDGFDFRPRPLA